MVRATIGIHEKSEIVFCANKMNAIKYRYLLISHIHFRRRLHFGRRWAAGNFVCQQANAPIHKAVLKWFKDQKIS